MAYFIHNKYDKNSIAALALIDQSANTVIDYYGNYNTYKYLDVSDGFGKLYDALSYITPNTILFDTDVTDGKSYFNFSSSIIVKSVQRGIITPDATDIEININTIDASKSIVLLNAQGTVSDVTTICLSNLTNNVLKVRVGYSGTAARISYQIIEYY